MDRVPSRSPGPPIESPRHYRVDEADRGLRLDQFLRRRIPSMSRTKAQAAIEDRVRIEGAAGRLRPSRRLLPGEVVEVSPPAPEAIPTAGEFEILHEDEHLLAVDKPAGRICHPNGRTRWGSILFSLRWSRREPDLALAHRLDRETTGVLLLTRTLTASRAVTRLFSGGRVEKTYLAVVRGIPEPEFVVDLPLGQDRRSTIFVKQGVNPSGRPSRTVVRRLEAHEDVALVEARPLTGRRHQVRVHLAAAGHPVLGDKLYGADEKIYLNAYAGRFDAAAALRAGGARHLLHAATLCLPHPITGIPLRLESPLPRDMRLLSPP